LKNLNYEGAEKGAERRARLIGEKAIEQRKKDILKLISEDQTITQTKMMQEMNLSRKQVQSALKQLVEAGIIVRSGSNRKGIWEIQDKE